MMGHTYRKVMIRTGLCLLLAVMLPGSVLAQDADPPLPPTPEPADDVPNAPMPEVDEDFIQELNTGSLPDEFSIMAGGIAKRVADINPGSGDSFPQYLEVFNNKLYFSAKGNTNDIELWVYDGVDAPMLAWNINPSGDSYPQYLKVFNGQLYFSADGGGGAGRELWTFDGTHAPYRVADICPAACSSDPMGLEVWHGYLIFGANGGDGHGFEQWVYSGLYPPMLLVDIAPGSVSSIPNYHKTYDDYNVYFSANGNDGYGCELWVHNYGGGISRVSDINPSGSSYPGYLEVFNNQLYFGATSDGSDHELWSFDYIHLPYRVANINTSGSSTPRYLKTFNNQLYFNAKGNANGAELWAYDGSHPPYQVADIDPGSSASSPEYLQVFNNKLYFGANGGDGAGKELWVYIPTVAKTYISSASYDGWVLESARTSNKGGSLNKTAATFRVGDDAGNRQYRPVMHFNTDDIPNNAVITAVKLQVKRSGYTGSNPFNTHGALYVDLRQGAFSNNNALQLADWQAPASKLAAGKVPKTSASNWHTLNLAAANFKYINKTGVTQLRLRFAKQDNGDNGADYVNFYSGNAGAANRPKLIITYYVP